MSVDEYEAIRLIDLEGMTQEECADKMHVARTTVQGIYMAARRKIAEALVLGRTLRIEGGQYELCNGMGKYCGMGGCHKRGGMGRRQADGLPGNDRPGSDRPDGAAVSTEGDRPRAPQES